LPSHTPLPPSPPCLPARCFCVIAVHVLPSSFQRISHDRESGGELKWQEATQTKGGQGIRQRKEQHRTIVRAHSSHSPPSRALRAACPLAKKKKKIRPLWLFFAWRKGIFSAPCCTRSELLVLRGLRLRCFRPRAIDGYFRYNSASKPATHAAEERADCVRRLVCFLMMQAAC
jgi:hypothetical protein